MWAHVLVCFTSCAHVNIRKCTRSCMFGCSHLWVNAGVCARMGISANVYIRFYVHALVSLVPTFTATIRHTTSTESNHPQFSRISNENVFFFFVEPTPACVLPWTLLLWTLQVKVQPLSVLFILIIFTFNPPLSVLLHHIKGEPLENWHSG